MGNSDVPDTGSIHHEFQQFICDLHRTAPLYWACGNRRSGSGSSGAMIRVLVVDDEATLRKNIARSLRRAGFEVITAADGAGARQALDSSDVDVLCLDIHLPDEDGLDLLEEVRQTFPGIPAIVMSGAANPEHRPRALRLGVEEFLSKPFRLAELKALVARCAETIEGVGPKGVRKTKKRWTRR